MFLWGCLTAERLEKSRRVIENLVKGWADGGRLIVGPPADDGNPFVVYGQRWLAEEIIPPALKTGRPFWHIDNGFWLPGRGTAIGYYRISYRGLAPVLLKDAPHREIERSPTFRPWRQDGSHILFAHPGLGFGRCVGLNMPEWIEVTRRRLHARTRRKIIEREKYCSRPLVDDLRGCWAVVTHSSNVAIDAVIAGIPVFVYPNSPAAPVGNPYLENIESPRMPDREAWFRSLMCQQFTIHEMRDGLACELLNRVKQQVDGCGREMCDRL